MTIEGQQGVLPTEYKLKFREESKSLEKIVEEKENLLRG